MIRVADLPTVNAALNLTAAILIGTAFTSSSRRYSRAQGLHDRCARVSALFLNLVPGLSLQRRLSPI